MSRTDRARPRTTLLARELDLTQISVGEVFRWHVQNHTKLGA